MITHKICRLAALRFFVPGFSLNNRPVRCLLQSVVAFLFLSGGDVIFPAVRFLVPDPFPDSTVRFLFDELFFRHDLILPLVFFFFFFFLFTRKTTIRRGLLFDLVLISSGRPIRFIFLPRFRVLRAVRDPIQRWVVTRLVVLTTTHDTRGMQSTWCAWVCAFKSVLLIFFCRDARMSFIHS